MKIKEQIERLRRQARAKAEAVQAYPLLSDTKEMQEAAYYPEWKYADSLEALYAVYVAADRIYNRPAHNQSDEDRLRKALSAVEQIDD